MMSWYWAAYLVIGFGVPETIALVSKRYKNTLSETVWHWCDVLPGQTLWQWSATHFFLFAFMTWLWVHMILRRFA